MGKIKSDGFILEEHLEKITTEPNCVLCNGELEGVTLEDRGFIEFLDGWWWICPNCKAFMSEFDQTQYKPWYHAPCIPYHRRSRKHWLAWLERQYGIKLTVI